MKCKPRTAGEKRKATEDEKGGIPIDGAHSTKGAGQTQVLRNDDGPCDALRHGHLHFVSLCIAIAQQGGGSEGRPETEALVRSCSLDIQGGKGRAGDAGKGKGEARKSSQI